MRRGFEAPLAPPSRAGVRVFTRRGAPRSAGAAAGVLVADFHGGAAGADIGGRGFGFLLAAGRLGVLEPRRGCWWPTSTGAPLAPTSAGGGSGFCSPRGAAECWSRGGGAGVRLPRGRRWHRHRGLGSGFYSPRGAAECWSRRGVLEPRRGCWCPTSAGAPRRAGAAAGVLVSDFRGGALGRRECAVMCPV